MGTRLVPPETAALLGALVALLAVSFGAVAAPAPLVVGSIKCLNCSPDDVKAEDAFRGLQVGIMCNSGAGEAYETKMLSGLDENGGFSIPLAADLLRDDGELDKDCFAQLHSAPETPCAGQTPPRIAKAGPGNDTIAAAAADASPTYLAVSDDTLFSPVACKCGKYKKKFMFAPPPPPPPRPPAPEYKPPTPTPTPIPTPEPSYGPPAPKPPAPPVEDEPQPFFHKHPKLKFMHKKKPCPPLVDVDIPRPNN
uniref:Proline-rich protein n=1 Tax=Oryza meridionalis TaxID=40149 RepID=A0A0E0CXY1_9ORYZ